MVWSVVLRETQKNKKNQDDMERTEQEREQKNKAKKKTEQKHDQIILKKNI